MEWKHFMRLFLFPPFLTIGESTTFQEYKNTESEVINLNV